MEFGIPDLGWHTHITTIPFETFKGKRSKLIKHILYTNLLHPPKLTAKAENRPSQKEFKCSNHPFWVAFFFVLLVSERVYSLQLTTYQDFLRETPSQINIVQGTLMSVTALVWRDDQKWWRIWENMGKPKIWLWETPTKTPSYVKNMGKSWEKSKTMRRTPTKMVDTNCGYQNSWEQKHGTWLLSESPHVGLLPIRKTLK